MRMLISKVFSYFTPILLVIVVVLCAYAYYANKEIKLQAAQLGSAKLGLEYMNTQRAQAIADNKEAERRLIELSNKRQERANVSAEVNKEITRMLAGIKSECTLSPELSRVFQQSYDSTSILRRAAE